MPLRNNKGAARRTARRFMPFSKHGLVPGDDGAVMDFEAFQDAVFQGDLKD